MVKKKSKNSDGLKAYIFKADPNSMEGKWLSTQANRTLSLKILIKKLFVNMEWLMLIV